MEKILYRILMVSMSPIAIPLLIFMALGNLLQFLFKASLLFIIVAINTPFAMMSNVSIVVFDYYFRSYFQKSRNHFKSSTCFWKLDACLVKLGVYLEESRNFDWNWSDPRVSSGIEIQILVSDFFKTVAGELLVVISAGIITFFTATLQVFYISMAISLVAVLHKWLNTDCLSKTALSCLCDGYGLNPMMFLYSFIGFFNIGCHPVAKCSFVASRAFLIVKNDEFIEEDGHNQSNNEVDQNEYITGPSFTTESYEEYVQNQDKPNVVPEMPYIVPTPKMEPFMVTIPAMIPFTAPPHPMEPFMVPTPKMEPFMMPYENRPPIVVEKMTPDTVLHGVDPSRQKVGHYRFENGAVSLETNSEVILPIKYKWNAFDTGLFQLSPRIDFIKRDGKYILKSFMVLKLLKEYTWEYPVERLELPEDYSKAKELYNFLVIVSSNDGFVTDKMRGRYEHSLTLSQIVEEVGKNMGYKIVDPIDKCFVVA